MRLWGCCGHAGAARETRRYPPPDEHVHYGERVSWFNVDDELPHYDGVSAEHAHRALATMGIKEER